tara:strand:- start:686 stop:3688 length:3003 start_codon:yes stop_codon:yes gene_type:complete
MAFHKTPKDTGVQNPYGLGDYTISLDSTEVLRKMLLGKNLQSSYLSDGNPVTPFYGIQQPGEFSYNHLSDTAIIDQNTVQETGLKAQTSLFLDNSYGPAGGYTDVLLIDVDKVLPRRGVGYVSPGTTQPQSFVSSTYTSAEVLETVNITNGIVNTLNKKILNDSVLQEQSSGFLRINLGYKQSQYLFEVNNEIGGLVPADYNVSTSPNQPILDGTDFMSRITNLYYGNSEIPGSYFGSVFVPDINGLKSDMISYQGAITANIAATADAIVNSIAGTNNVPTNDTNKPTPSDMFINYMGKKQQKSLFSSLKYNIYRPDYSRVTLQRGVDNVTPFYYVGSKDNDPGRLDSPTDAVPRDEFGRSTGAIVYGPSTVAKEFETVNGLPLWHFYQFGLNGSTYMDGGGLAGGWTWFGNYSFASLNAPPGMLYTRSINKPKRKGGILDETQKLIDSAPLMGGARRKHVGHAIDQTSKVFDDGYKEISKGSGARVINPGDVGLLGRDEFCRTWTKDNPYYRMDNLQRYEGNHLKKAYSILDKTYDLNIAPVMGVNVDKEATEKNVKKYMFSIENLAWRGTPELIKLPQSERGPNGGRIMWFPPYDISVSDTNSAQWNSTTFLGRPEPVYTYNYTERIGTLGFKVVVDHPSILNVIAQKELKGKDDYTADKTLESFFAGCKKYDIYELASMYTNLSIDEILSIQNDVTDAFTNQDEDVMTSYANSEVNSAVAPEGGFSVGGNVTNDGFSVGGTNLPQGEEIPPEVQQIQNNDSSVNDAKAMSTTKILAKLLGEQNYFKHLEDSNEFVYNSLKEKLKYFSPSFHSTTPEGLNSRLTFLLQCTRPGRTMPTVKPDVGATDVDADNTAFGAPPICVLRIGDFYHTKIAIDSVSFSYDPLILDLNPEGIGVQPMIATVQMNFKYIGGQGLKEPVSQLQNALSSNYFANTEVFDPSSLRTDVEEQFDPQAMLTLLGVNSANNNTGNGTNNANNAGNSTAGNTEFNAAQYNNQTG